MRSFLLALPLLAACEEPIACDDYAAASVMLTLVDDAGAHIAGATVTVSNGELTEDCYEDDQGYTCGYEMAGELTISASAQFFAPAELTITVDEDDCHVITEQVTLEMEPVDCTTEAVPGMMVTVSNDLGESLADAAVSYELDGSEADCVASGGSNEFFCAEEQTGEMILRVSADGHEPHEETVTVSLDEVGCHPVTELVDVVLVSDLD